MPEFENALPTMFTNGKTVDDEKHWRSTHARIANGAVVPQQLIGGTPMIDLSEFSANPKVKIYGKCEYMNPSGSIKDRIAQEILTRALETGELKPGMTVVAATSGNTGAAIAMACAIRGFDYIVITNKKTSKEKIDAMKAYGGQVIVAESGVPADHPDHYQNIETTMCAQNPNYYGVNQYDNPYNADAYEKTLGPEIWSQTKGAVTHFIAGGSTGGTITGTGRYLKSVDPTIKIMLADPKGSVLWDYFVNDVPEEDLVAKSWEVEGVGKDSIPGVLQTEYIDGAVKGCDASSFRICRMVAESSGILLGGSSGLNLHAARVLSSQIKEGVIVTVLCDSGVKYLSKIFNDEWLESKNLNQPLSDVKNFQVAWKKDQSEASDDEDADHGLWSRDDEEKELRFLDEIATHMVEYYRNSARAADPVSTYNSPLALHEKFKEVGIPLAIGTGEEPVSMSLLTTEERAEEETEEVEEIVVDGPPGGMRRMGELSWELGAAGEEEEEEEQGQEGEEISREEVLALSVELIESIASGKEPLDAARLGSLLWTLSNALLEDLTDRDDLRVPGNSLETFPVELVRNVMGAVETLVVALTFEPEDAVTQRSGHAIPAIGTHRVAAAEIIAVLLQIGCQDIDERIAKLKLPNDGQFVLVSLVRMFFKYSWSSALHATVVRLILAALVSPHEPLWAPMFEGGDESLQGSLAASMKTALATKPISTRDGNVGSVIILANALHELETCDDVERQSVRTTLQEDATWRAAIDGEDSPLANLNNEQAGGLCGPKPQKSPVFMDSGMGANVISSQELLRMLQHISLGQ
ncbi:Tryptophan synthase beta subunit-like PLP-dependent enzymes superfamily [Ostreococcus tauri]|uniref:Tryptophan synthase beta subunit-like PLP-dependent enzymes superfamily n=2 Tax=Ostreococcus tauri TaxID=70448 RepID=A0A090N3W1_OSTTA|nr:Tryptophan synthase beta subunit-like PLP-dependent enzymes superfamily [Ostreococcus tauri]CEF98808.1 Tryptophan synthase beta subunit-like PLP-dependent enzymes superfamily [Ostreococcus tauri]|eukprot:XP_022839479.1 Tryptophan synthase beta subunit-like PLP-dependent enzymes superfamily [Ostreococcus tauri]